MDKCPLTDFPFILNKNIHENVIQHKKLYGKVNKNYTKYIDIPSFNPWHTNATIPSHSNAAQSPHILPSSTSDPYAHPTLPLEDQCLLYEPTAEYPSPPNDNLIQTDTFNVPVPPSANLCTPNHDTTAIFFDPTDYLHFSSWYHQQLLPFFVLLQNKMTVGPTVSSRMTRVTSSTSFLVPWKSNNLMGLWLMPSVLA